MYIGDPGRIVGASVMTGGAVVLTGDTPIVSFALIGIGVIIGGFATTRLIYRRTHHADTDH